MTAEAKRRRGRPRRSDREELLIERFSMRFTRAAAAAVRQAAKRLWVPPGQFIRQAVAAAAEVELNRPRADPSVPPAVCEVDPAAAAVLIRRTVKPIAVVLAEVIPQLEDYRRERRQAAIDRLRQMVEDLTDHAGS